MSKSKRADVFLKGNRLANFTPEQRFHQKYVRVPESGCWIWEGSTLAGGYGQFAYGPKDNCTHVTAHRFSWELHRGKIPSGLCVLHRCDVRSCVNPSHLFLGTLGENNTDRHRKGRTRHSMKVTKALAEYLRTLTKDDAAKINAIAAETGINVQYLHMIRRGNRHSEAWV